MSEVPVAAEVAGEQTTRDCVDPWAYVEVRVNGDVAPCCVRGPVGNLAEATLPQILSGEPVRRLRAALLTGDLDSICAGCRQTAPTAPQHLQQKVRALRAIVRLPEGFDPRAYLRANPDVAATGVAAETHFLNYGYLEGRALRHPHDAAEAAMNGEIGSIRKEIVEWCTAAAHHGHAEAQFRVGVMYATGQGVEKDAAQAVLWYQRAAEQGHRYAQQNIAVMLLNGDGIRRDDEAAFQWSMKAAEQGVAEAQHLLGELYATGRGTSSDHQAARNWYEKAATQGNAAAAGKLDALIAAQDAHSAAASAAGGAGVEPADFVTVPRDQQVLHSATLRPASTEARTAAILRTSSDHQDHAGGILFLQTADPLKYRTLLDLTSRTVTEYCSRHNFGYQTFLGICRGHHAWQAAFNRIVLLRNILNNGFRGWVCYLDADAFIYDLDFDLAGYLSEKSHIAFIAATDRVHEPGRPYWLVNSGSFLINLAGPVGRKIVWEWADQFDAITDQQLREMAEWALDDQVMLQNILRCLASEEAAILTLRGEPNLINYFTGIFIKQIMRADASFEERIHLLRAETDRVLCRS